MSNADTETAPVGTRQTAALLVLVAGYTLDLIDGSIVNVALPAIQQGLHTSTNTVAWTAVGYSLTFALLLILSGRLGDIFGYKRLFLIGIGLFSLTSLLSGLAWLPPVLIITRLAQGASAALMSPQVMATIQLLYRDKTEKRALINGIFGGFGSLATTLAPVLGALLLKANLGHLGWRLIFLVNVPLGILLFIAGIRWLPDLKSNHPHRIDWLGTGWLTAALSLLVYPLIEGRAASWPAWTFIAMLTSLPVFGGFIWWELRLAHANRSPLVDPRLFHRARFSAGLAMQLLFMAVLGSFGLIMTLLLQQGSGFSPLQAVLTLIFSSLGIGLVSVAFGKAVVRYLGDKALVYGPIITGLGLGLVAWQVHTRTRSLTTWQLSLPLLIMGIGFGLVFSALIRTILTQVEPYHAGMAAGLTNTMQQLGAAIGISTIGTIFFGKLNHGFSSAFVATTSVSLGVLIVCAILGWLIIQRSTD